VAITDKIYVKNHQQIASQIETSFPKSAFSGATMDMLFRGEALPKLDETTRDRALDFAEDFMDCDCEANPHCGHPEEKFVRHLLELRESGMGPDAIVDVMGDDCSPHREPPLIRSVVPMYRYFAGRSGEIKK